MPGSDPADRWHPRRIAGFLGLGLCLYLALFLAAERAIRQPTNPNPFWRIAQVSADQDWLILGASHAIPLNLADTEAKIEAESGLQILNLAVTGSGPFVWHLLAERYLREHHTRRILVVIDGFAFRDRRWNEDRIGDSDLMPTIPWDCPTVATFAAALAHGLPPATFADAVTGFSKINDPERFQPETWDAEALFPRSARPSDAADAARIAFLYPGPTDPGAEIRAFDRLDALVLLARAKGAEVVLVRPPLPDRFRARLPGEADIAALLETFARARGFRLVDMSRAAPDQRLYFDPDHLNAAGVAVWLDAGLRALLVGQ